VDKVCGQSSVGDAGAEEMPKFIPLMPRGASLLGLQPNLLANTLKSSQCTLCIKGPP